MSLIILANDFPPSTGGIQRYLYELAAALQRRGEELLVIAPDQPGAQDFDASSPVPTVRVPAGNRLQSARALAQAATQSIRRRQPDNPVKATVAGNWWPDGLAAWLVRRRTATPYVVMGYGREMIQTGANPVKWLIQNLIIGGAAGGLAISRYSAQQLQRRGLKAGRLAVIYGGADPSTFEADEHQVAQVQAELNPAGRPVMLTVSRLVQRKGHSQVIAALPQVINQVGPVRYLIVGTGPEEQALRRLADQHKVSQFVEFLGQVDNRKLPALYRAASVFIMPSRDLYGHPIEGLGLVYFEAGLGELPAIGSTTGGIPEAIADGETGLLVNPEEPDQIAAALVRLLSNEDFAAQLGKAARARVLRDFTWDRVAERFQKALEKWGLAEGWPPEAA